MASYHIKKVSVPNSIWLHIYTVILYIVYVYLFLDISFSIYLQSFLFFPRQEPLSLQQQLHLIQSKSTGYSLPTLIQHCTSICTYHFGKKTHSFSGVIHTDSLVLIIPPSLDINRERLKDASDSAHFSIHEKKKKGAP